MPGCTLPRRRPLVTAFCAAHGVAYTEASPLESCRRVLRHLPGVRPDLQGGARVLNKPGAPPAPETPFRGGLGARRCFLRRRTVLVEGGVISRARTGLRLARRASRTTRSSRSAAGSSPRTRSSRAVLSHRSSPPVSGQSARRGDSPLALMGHVKMRAGLAASLTRLGCCATLGFLQCAWICPDIVLPCHCRPQRKWRARLLLPHNSA
jgi:hypothetical protein